MYNDKNTMDIYRNIFKNLAVIDPSPTLYPRVISRIERGMRMRVRIKLALSSATSLLSLAGIVLTVKYIFTDLATTGSYLKLIFSDGGAILSYWHAFILALAESVPSIGIIIILGGMLSLIFSLRVLSKNLHTALPLHTQTV